MGVLVLRTIIARLMPSHRVHTRPARGDATSVRLSESPETLARYLEDAAHYPGGHAVGVAHPETEAEAAAVVRQAQRLLPIGAQSSLTGGATPMGEVVLTTERLDRIVEVGNTEVTVQAGVPLTVLRETLDQRGALYPPIPTFEGAFAGGVVATNAAGAGTFKYGSMRDWVRRLTVILADGSVLDLTRGHVRAHPDGYFEIVTDADVRRVPVPTYEMPAVPKRSAGYFAAPEMDLVDLFVGSEGTLGVVTEITFAIVPRCPSTCLAWIPVPSEAEAIALVATLRAEAQSTWRSHDPRGIDVAAIEHLDRRSLDLVKEDGADRTHGVEISDGIAVAILAQIELPPDSVPSPDQAYAQIAGALSSGSPDTPLVRLCRLLAQAGVTDRATTRSAEACAAHGDTRSRPRGRQPTGRPCATRHRPGNREDGGGHDCPIRPLRRERAAVPDRVRRPAARLRDVGTHLGRQRASQRHPEEPGRHSAGQRGDPRVRT